MTLTKLPQSLPRAAASPPQTGSLGIRPPVSNQETSGRIVDPKASGGQKNPLSKTLVNFWLDAALMVIFVALSIVSVINQFVFPPGVDAKGWLLWGMGLNQWTSLQFGTLAMLGFGIVIHVMLHWSWVCSVAAKKLFRAEQVPDAGLQTVYGVGLLIGLLLTGAVIVGIAMMTIQMPPQ